MLYFTAPDDDTPTKRDSAFANTLNHLNRDKDWTGINADNTRRMLEACRAGDPTYTPAVVRMTLAAARNAAESLLRTYDAVEAEVLPARPLPVAKPFGRRVSDASLPAVVSTGSL